MKKEMKKDASYYKTLRDYHETLVKHSGVVKEEDLYVDNYQKDRFFIDAPNNQIVHASLHRIANGDARSWEITVSLYPFQLVRDARNVANSTAAFFHSLTTANCGVSIVDSTMESFLLLFTEYFVSMESNFEELTEQTYRGLCICTNCDHVPTPLKLTDKKSILKAVSEHPAEKVSMYTDYTAISIDRQAFQGADFQRCVFVLDTDYLGLLVECNAAVNFNIQAKASDIDDKEMLALMQKAILDNRVIAVNFMY